MSVFSWVWAGILATGVVIETVALRQRAPGKPSGTFSEFCRWLAGTNTKPVAWRAYPFGLGLAALFVWFFGHVMFGWGP